VRSGNRDRKTHQTFWDDLDPWVEQVYAEHGYQTVFEVYLHSDRHKLLPAVVMRLTKPAVRGGDPALIQDWKTFNPRDIGAVEAAALFLISRALLTLDNDGYRERAKQTSLLDA